MNNKYFILIIIVLSSTLAGCINSKPTDTTIINDTVTSLTPDIRPCLIIEPYPEGWTQKQVDKFNALLSEGNVSCNDLNKTYRREN